MKALLTPAVSLKRRAAAADDETGMADLDVTIIERYADHLYRRAAARVTLATCAGALLGSVLGGLPRFVSSSHSLIPNHLTYATLLIGAAAGGFLGYRFGESRAYGLRLQAQLALHQLQVEKAMVRPAAPAAPPAPVAAPAVPAPPVTAPVAPPPVAAPAPPLAAPAPPAPPVAPLAAPAPPVAAPAPAPAPVQAPPPAQPPLTVPLVAPVQAPPVAVPEPAAPAPPAALVPPAPPRLVEPAPPLAAPPLSSVGP